MTNYRWQSFFLTGAGLSFLASVGLWLLVAEREGSAVPDAVRWLRRVFGLEEHDGLPARDRSEPKP